MLRVVLRPEWLLPMRTIRTCRGARVPEEGQGTCRVITQQRRQPCRRGQWLCLFPCLCLSVSLSWIIRELLWLKIHGQESCCLTLMSRFFSAVSPAPPPIPCEVTRWVHSICSRTFQEGAKKGQERVRLAPRGNGWRTQGSGGRTPRILGCQCRLRAALGCGVVLPQAHCVTVGKVHSTARDMVGLAA